MIAADGYAYATELRRHADAFYGQLATLNIKSRYHYHLPRATADDSDIDAELMPPYFEDAAFVPMPLPVAFITPRFDDAAITMTCQ